MTHEITENQSFNTQPPEGGWSDYALSQRWQVVSTHSRPKAAGSLFTRGYQIALSFNTQPPEGGWLSSCAVLSIQRLFQHTAARRRLEYSQFCVFNIVLFQHTAARRRLVCDRFGWCIFDCFNTQPPEGGWPPKTTHPPMSAKFQHTAARRRLAFKLIEKIFLWEVSTHSRPKAAGIVNFTSSCKCIVSTHSRPKAAGARKAGICYPFIVSTHSRPKAAGTNQWLFCIC